MDASDLASIVGLVIAAVALLISVGSLAVTAIGVVVSYCVARWYGGIAAVEASRKLQEEDSKKTRLTALRSLLHQTERIRKIVSDNTGLDHRSTIQPLVRLPVLAFETAFVSGKPGVSASEETVAATTDYLLCADRYNSLVDIYPVLLSSVGGQMGVSGSSEPSLVILKVQAISLEVTSILEALWTRLAQEIAAAEEGVSPC